LEAGVTSIECWKNTGKTNLKSGSKENTKISIVSGPHENGIVDKILKAKGTLTKIFGVPLSFRTPSTHYHLT
jgi:hypothetical protein